MVDIRDTVLEICYTVLTSKIKDCHFKLKRRLQTGKIHRTQCKATRLDRLVEIILKTYYNKNSEHVCKFYVHFYCDTVFCDTVLYNIFSNNTHDYDAILLSLILFN